MHRRSRHLIGKALGANLVLDSRYLTESDGTLLQTWPDRSGNGKNATQATSTKQPTVKTGANGINGNPALSFDGTADAMAVSNLTAAPHQYCLAVVKLTTASMICELGLNSNSVNGFAFYGQQGNNVIIKNTGGSVFYPGTNNWIGTDSAVISYSYGTIKELYKNLSPQPKGTVFDNFISGTFTETLYIMSRGQSNLYSSGLLGMMIIQPMTATFPYMKRVHHCAAFSFKIACS